MPATRRAQLSDIERIDLDLLAAAALRTRIRTHEQDRRLNVEIDRLLDERLERTVLATSKR